MKANETKSVHVTFTTLRATCPPVHINDVQIPQENHVKYLGHHLDRRLTWHPHIFAKRKQLEISLTKMYWLLGRKSKLYQQQAPRLQSNIETNLDVWHSTLGHDLKFQHRNFGPFSVESLASDSECPLVCAKLSHPQEPSNTFSKRRNLPLQLPLRCSPPCTPPMNSSPHFRAANPQTPATILLTCLPDSNPL
jgi:hypothetical protein